MQIGDLYRVIRNGHTKPQIDNVIMIVKFVGSVYVEAVNLKTLRHHHYLRENLEKL